MSICPICEKIMMKPFYVKPPHKLIVCQDCRHITWDDIPCDAVLAKYYEEEYTETHNQNSIQNELQEYYRSHANELSRFSDIPMNKLEIADIGCSYPIFLEQAKQAGLNTAIGVDWSPQAQAYGASRQVTVITPPEFEAMDDEVFDILRYSHTIEHMPDPAKTLASQSKKLRIGGLLYITQPNFPVFFARESMIDIQDSVWPTHLHFFNPISMRHMLEKNGFEIVRYFSVGDGESHKNQYGDMIDIELAKTSLASLANKGEVERGPFNNYPYYSGENSAFFAIRLT